MGVGRAGIDASPHLRYLVCERILARRYVAIATTGDAVSSDTLFVSQTSHNGGGTTKTNDTDPSITRFVSESSHNLHRRRASHRLPQPTTLPSK